ncbi:hypothetical protein BU24DRAFT_273113 [Aaosphaeria arxii CBS 175.79]|uniref:Uncharacterized protein n=1 Tax=Aaosphaeria arxii CBS 175.79 TaxID=1450172 RepID=A0A6A5XHD0_9PLEO|nr:uncharacterized protein BU24DRAFT_273113 [Aaosphaeria arxii CBS 175.79]KAF2012257.1 hypothetical protein BU24DRAFT_273113 [Aaosphaeria arxii CBS 175.79]
MDLASFRTICLLSCARVRRADNASSQLARMHECMCVGILYIMYVHGRYTHVLLRSRCTLRCNNTHCIPSPPSHPSVLLAIQSIATLRGNPNREIRHGKQEKKNARLSQRRPHREP